MDLLILVTAYVVLIVRITIWMVVEAGVAEAVAAIQDKSASDPKIDAIDKRQIPNLNAQGVKPRAGLDKSVRIGGLRAGKIAVNRSTVYQDAGAEQVCPSWQERGKAVDAILKRPTSSSLAVHDGLSRHVSLTACITECLLGGRIIEFQLVDLRAGGTISPSSRIEIGLQLIQIDLEAHVKVGIQVV